MAEKVIFGLIRALAVLSALAFIPEVGQSASAATDTPQIISAEPYPVGDLKVTRQDVSPTSFHLNIENLNIAPAESNRSRSQTWLIAGARGVPPEVEVERATFVHLREGRITSSTATAPENVSQNLVRVADLGLYRQYWVYTLTVNAASPAGQDSFWVLKNATILVNIGSAAPPADSVSNNRWKPQIGESGMLGSLLLNPDITPAYYAVEYGDPLETWSDWTQRIADPAKSGNLYRFSVYGGGLYRLTAGDIYAMTSATVTTKPETWRVYKNGQEVALLADSRGSSAVYLPIPKRDTDGLQEQVFWLDASGKHAKRQLPLRLVTQATNSAANPETPITSGSYSRVHRELVDYNPKLRAGAGFDRWVWTDLDADRPVSVDVHMPDHFQPEPGSTLRTTVKYGFTNFPPVQPSLLLLVGNTLAGETTLTVQQGTAVMDLPAELLKPGTNTVALRLNYPFEAEAKRPATVQLLQTDWSQALVPPGDESTFSASALGTTSGLHLQFSSALPDDAVVLGYQQDVPTLLAVTGNHVVLPDESYSSYYVGRRITADPVPVITRVSTVPQPGNFKSARSIIIAASQLSTASQALKPMHEARGLSTEIYSAQTIYDAFSYGRADATAVRNFLRYLFYKAPGEAPEYVTLVGEASDFKGDPSIVPPTTQVDLLPAAASSSMESPQGDQLYSAAIGSDLVADFIVGRIPAGTPAQVTGYIEKLKAFERAPAGDWSRVTEFVMDDNDEFPDVVGRIVAEGMAPTADTRLFRQWDFDYVPNLRVPGKKRSWTATESLIEKFNEGIGVINFFGHGGPNLWSHERLLHLSDLPLLTNALRLPLITCASCDNAWISYPTPPVKASIGEQMVLKPNGGALGLFGPVAGASPYEHSTLVQALMEGVTRHQLRTIGDLTAHAENQYYSISRSASIPDQYLLLGDPTVKLPMAKVEPTLAAELANDGRDVKITFNAPADGASTGLLVLSSSKDRELVTSSVVSMDSMPWNVPLPASEKPGAIHAVLMYGINSKMAGATVSIPPLPDRKQPEPRLVDRQGSVYDIEPVPSIDVGPAAAESLKFKIRGPHDTTVPVHIEAISSRLDKVGEVAQVQMTTGSQWSVFDLQINGPLDPPEAKVSLLVREMETPGAEVLTTSTFMIPVQGTAELEFVEGSEIVYSGDHNLMAGKTVYMEATLRNSGTKPARNISLQALADSPTTGSELQTINDSTSYRIEELLPGEERKVTFRWENATAGTYTDTYLVANRNKVVREGNNNNNFVKLPQFEVGSMGNYFIESVAVVPVIAVPGSTATLTAVLRNNAPSGNHPVTTEVGWGRTLDGETSSTRFPLRLQDGYATFTKELVVPHNFTFAFAKVNADLEVEENNSGDNTMQTDNMVATALEVTGTGAVSLGHTLISGTAYNLDMPFENQLRVSPQYTSVTTLLTVDHQNITTGSASALDTPDDNAWWVAPWRVAVSPGENAGEIGFRLPLETVHTDVPGVLKGVFVQEAGVPTLEVALEDQQWKRITTAPYANKFGAVLGALTTENGALNWKMRAVDNAGVILEYLQFYPKAVQWDSPPYLLPQELRSKLLTFSVDTQEETAWEKFQIEWRTGQTRESGELDWTPWAIVEGWSAPLSSDEYLQVRIFGVPVSDKHPFLNNFRLSVQ